MVPRASLFVHVWPERTFRVNRGVMFQYFEWNCRSDGSLWRELAGRARGLENLGGTAGGFPAADKGVDGGHDVGDSTYGPYDLGGVGQEGRGRRRYGGGGGF